MGSFRRVAGCDYPATNRRGYKSQSTVCRAHIQGNGIRQEVYLLNSHRLKFGSAHTQSSVKPCAGAASFRTVAHAPATRGYRTALCKSGTAAKRADGHLPARQHGYEPH